MNSVVPFNFESQQVRVIDLGGEPWVVAKDVAEALGVQWKGGDSAAHVPDEWKGVRSVRTPGGNQEMIILSEQGLYFLLGRSDKPKALPFQKWIAGEVLPAIRRTGQYQHRVPGTLPNLPQEVRTIFDFVNAAENQNKKGLK
ncbi:MAG: hypothetical protein HQL80_05555 [Magnetococcales bacterium]|nr:hypothetical protein [Magnetococcales bacterium]